MKAKTILDLFSEYYITDIPYLVKIYYDPIGKIIRLIEEEFISLEWLRVYLLETRLLCYNFNQMLWILSGIEIGVSKKIKTSYISYVLRNRKAFEIKYIDLKILEKTILVNNETYKKYEYIRGNNILILPKTIFNLDYTHIHLSSPGKDEHFYPISKEEGVPDPIIQLPNNINAKIIILDLFFLEELPDIWGSNKIEYIDIRVGKFMNLNDRFSELSSLKTLKLKNIIHFPKSIYECQSLRHLLIKGKVKCDESKITELKSLTNFELYTYLSKKEKNKWMAELAYRNINCHIVGYSDIDFELDVD